jgi:hypothetical protein
MFVCWAALTLAAVGCPLALFLAWPVTGMVFLAALASSFRGVQPVFDHGEPLRLGRGPARWLAAGILAILLAAVSGTVSSMVPSMAWVSRDGLTLHPYSISVTVAPGMFTAIALAAVLALRVRSPRRIAVLATVTVCTWPLLAMIRGMREPFFDLDGRERLLLPWAPHTYVASIAVASASAIGLMWAVNRLAAHLPVPPSPPPARVVR